jgi:hypothetical protein
MATYGSVWSPDLVKDANLIANSVGVLANSASGIIQLGKHRLFRVAAISQTSAPTTFIIALRITMGISTGVTAATPTSLSDFVLNNQECIFDTGEAFDQIQVASLTADNGAGNVAYCIMPLSKF